MNLVEVSLRNNINKFINCSSISAYGDIEFPNTDENYRFSPTNLYGATKAASDLILSSYNKTYNLDIISLRLSTVYGARRKTDCFINDMINAAINESELKLPFNKTLCWPYIYVNDAVSAIISFLFTDKKTQYAYNISGPDFPSYETIFQNIKNKFKKFNVEFQNKIIVHKREKFSINKSFQDIAWKPDYDIIRGIDDLIENLKL